MAANVEMPSDRIGAVVIEPSIVFANHLLQMVRDVRKVIGREHKPVWMPPQRYGVVLMTLRLPERARDEVVSMGLRSGVSRLTGVRDFELRIDPPGLERLADGSMLIQSRAWSSSPEFQIVFDTVRAGLESTGAEVTSCLEATGGLRFIFGWIPGPCSLTSIPPASLSTVPGATSISGLVSGVMEPVGATPMVGYRRLRIVRFDEGQPVRD